MLSVFDSNNDRFSSRARIKLYEGGNANLPEIPVQLLRPVHPDKMGQSVVMLVGDYKGQEGKIKGIQGDGNCVVLLMGTMLIVEAKTEKVVRLEKVD